MSKDADPVSTLGNPFQSFITHVVTKGHSAAQVLVHPGPPANFLTDGHPLACTGAWDYSSKDAGLGISLSQNHRLSQVERGPQGLLRSTPVSAQDWGEAQPPSGEKNYSYHLT